MPTPRAIGETLGRILGIGVAAAVLVGVVGWALERNRFGRNDQASVARVEADLGHRLDTSADMLGSLASRIAAEQELIRAAPRDPEPAGRLFDLLAAAIPIGLSASTGVTVYDKDAAPMAWAGRVSEDPKPRIDSPAALLVASDPLGPRLVRLEPIVDRNRPGAPRLGTIVVEQLLENVRRTSSLPDTFVLSGALVPVSLRTELGDPSRSPYSFVISSSGGQPLVEAWVDPSDLAAARRQWRDGERAAVLAVLTLILVFSAAPLIEVRRRQRARRQDLVLANAGLVAILLAVRAVVWFAATPLLAGSPLSRPISLFVNALMLAAIVWLALDLIERRRVGRPRPPLLVMGANAIVWTSCMFALAGASDTGVVWAYERFLQGLVSRTALDLLHFSLHPLDAARIVLSFGLVLLHAGVIWGAAVVLRLADLAWRRPRRRSLATAAVLSWIAGAGVATLAASRLSGPTPFIPQLVALAAVGGCAYLLAKPRGRMRRASQAARLGALFLALVVPALAMYPSLQAFATSAKEQLVAETFGPQAVTLREDLQRQLDSALGDIDRMSDLPSLVEDTLEGELPTTDRAFTIWSHTALKDSRLTSAIELYAANGRLVSRFALNFPEYGVAPHSATGCRWVVFEEVSQFAASERPVLRASRGICAARDHLVGAVVVRVMLDYRTLPFLSSQRPSFESLRPEGQTQLENDPGRGVEFTVYGWSRAPISTLASGVWPLPDATFARLVQSRQPFWETLTRADGKAYRVYFLNDRGGIYALGYPVMTTFGHLVSLAELIFLTGVLWAVLLGGGTLFNALTSRTPASGRALLREVRSSFYRKLWLAFVGGAVVPVVILAFATRAYFANQFTAGVQRDAVKTATVAQRLVEDYATLEQRGANALDVLDDQIMVLVGQAIDQNVNLFDPRRLQATSERDLFASGVLMLRTPGDVYRHIVIDRLPTFVGDETVGSSSYLLAAAPVRASGREGIVTVPLTSRRQELDQQIDDLDRQVLFASVLFVLLGAGLGYWMAERIADPVNRLTRATRRIARGDLDARIAATSSDELGRLVEDFNRMAADLKRQRSELERTQRLEAWADMARQVAHDIKNPLTPIQLSAEHARRVNLDRGAPLSPVLDDCMNAILTQVKLLRQIAAEFSSFASSPTPRPEVTSLPALIEEVVESYRAGLSGRVAIDVQAGPDLPLLSIDRTLLARALTNVIENALYAMPAGGTLSIASRRSAHDGEPSVLITVTDTGVGMDPEALAKIFEPYFSTKATGTGLGLTIAKRNVTLNGGTISVDSRRGGGTTVTIALPASRESES